MATSKPRNLGRVTLSFDIVQTGGDFWHKIEEVTEALVERDISNLDVILYGWDESGKLIVGETSVYDVENLTIDNMTKAGE